MILEYSISNSTPNNQIDIKIPSTVDTAWIKAMSGGGGGGSPAGLAYGPNCGGGGSGGAGGIIWCKRISVTPGSTIHVTIGLGGSAGGWVYGGSLANHLDQSSLVATNGGDTIITGLPGGDIIVTGGKAGQNGTNGHGGRGGDGGNPNGRGGQGGAATPYDHSTAVGVVGDPGTNGSLLPSEYENNDSTYGYGIESLRTVRDKIDWHIRGNGIHSNPSGSGQGGIASFLYTIGHPTGGHDGAFMIIWYDTILK